MKKFEYELVPQPPNIDSITEFENFLNALGTVGWELCCHDYGCFIFKREIS